MFMKLGKLFKYKIIQILIFLLYALIAEWTFSIIMFSKIYNYFFCDIFILLLFSLPILFWKNRIVDIIYLSAIYFALDFIFVFNAHYYILFGDVFSLSYINYLGEGLNLFSISYLKPHLIALAIVFFLVFVTTLVLFRIFVRVDQKTNKEEKKKDILTRLCLFLAITISSVGSFSLSNYLTTNYEVKNRNNLSAGMVSLARSNNYSLFGPLTYYAKEILPGKTYMGKDMLRSFFSSKVDTKNAFTGLLNDYNVIEIMVETGAYSMINEFTTPNLYSFASNGLRFENNYVKNKTNISEIIGILGSYSTDLFDFSKTDYGFPFAIPNLVKLGGYTSFYAHSVPKSKDIYRRNTFMSNFGFDKTYFFEDLTPNESPWDWDNYTLDTVTMGDYQKGTGLIGYIKNTPQPFYGFWTSLSMHGGYSYQTGTATKLINAGYRTRLDEIKKQGQWINPLEGNPNNEASCIDNWMMACMCFDDALGIMIDGLKQMGIFDKTLFVLYGDHDIYYQGKSNVPLSHLIYNTDSHEDYRTYKTELVIYNDDLTKTINSTNSQGVKYYTETFTSPHIIVPTILDLIGVDYNNNFYLSSSIFSPTYKKELHAIYSYELGFLFNNVFMSRNLSSVTKYYVENVSEEEKIAIVLGISKFLYKQSLLNTVYQTNLFSEENYEDYCYK